MKAQTMTISNSNRIVPCSINPRRHPVWRAQNVCEENMADSRLDGIDWSKHSIMTCVCKQCINQFRSETKGFYTQPLALLSRRPCPNCGGHELSRSSSDPELQTLS